MHKIDTTTTAYVSVDATFKACLLVIREPHFRKGRPVAHPVCTGVWGIWMYDGLYFRFGVGDAHGHPLVVDVLVAAPVCRNYLQNYWIHDFRCKPAHGEHDVREHPPANGNVASWIVKPIGWYFMCETMICLCYIWTQHVVSCKIALLII